VRYVTFKIVDDGNARALPSQPSDEPLAIVLPLCRLDDFEFRDHTRELGPGYSDAVVASFLEKVNKEIDARVAEQGMPRLPTSLSPRRAASNLGTPL
jgi:hypothetical protein